MADERHGADVNPRGRRPGDRRLAPRRGAGSAMWIALGFLLLLAIGQLIFFSLQSGDAIPYSEFKRQLQDGRVSDVVIAEDHVRSTLRTDGGTRALHPPRAEDPQPLEELMAKGVGVKGEITNRWLGEIFGWVILLVFLVAVWSFMFRRI